MKVKFTIDGTGQEFQISRYTVVDVRKDIFHLDELADGTWRLTVSKSMIDPKESIVRRLVIRGLENGKPRHMRGLSAHPSWTKFAFEIKRINGIPSPNGRCLQFESNIDNNTWRILYSNELIPDLSKFTGVTITKEG